MKIQKKNWEGWVGGVRGGGGTESIRTQVSSYLSQFVLILVNSYAVFGQFVLILLNLVNSYSFWSIRTQFGQFVLIPKI